MSKSNLLGEKNTSRSGHHRTEIYNLSRLITVRVCNKSNTTRGEGTAYPSGAPEFTIGFSGDRVARSLVFCVVFCRPLFFILSSFLWSLSVEFTASDYHCGVS